MTRINDFQQAELPESILVAAAKWYARINDASREGRVDSSIQLAFEAWLDKDPRHQQAYNELEEVWLALQHPVEQLISVEDKKHITLSHSRLNMLSSLKGFFQRPTTLAASVMVLFLSYVCCPNTIIHHFASDYASAVGEQKKVTLADGSQITLNSDTAINVDYTQQQRHIDLLQGEAWFDVAKNAERPFIVETDNGQIKVTGTQFNVHIQDNKTTVSLVNGRVELSSSQNKPGSRIVLSPLEQATLTKNGIKPVHHFDATAETAWLHGQFVFYNSRLADVVAELNQHRHGHIMIADDNLEQLRVSGVFKMNEPDTVLDIMAQTLPIKVSKLTDLFIILSKSQS